MSDADPKKSYSFTDAVAAHLNDPPVDPYYVLTGDTRLLHSCSVCGAVVKSSNFQRHDAWHAAPSPDPEADDGQGDQR